MTTAIANPGAALGSIEFVRSLSGLEGAWGMVSRAIPGELDEEQRQVRGMSVIEGAAIYLANADAKQRNSILQCTRQSLVEALVNLASVNLTLTKSLGHAYLIPYGQAVSMMIGYKGLVELIYRTGAVSAIQTGVVYQGEVDAKRFDYQAGSDGYVTHKPMFEILRTWETTYAAWMVAEMQGGGRVIEVVPKADLVKIRKASKMPDGPAWKYWTGQLTRKASVRRGSSYLPKGTGTASVALARALSLENAEYDLGKYSAMRKVESRKLTDEAAATLGGTDPGATPAEDGQSPPPKSTDETFAKGREALWEAVKEKRAGVSSSLDDKGFMAAVITSLFGKGTQIKSKAHLKVLNDALLVKGLFDWDTGDKIPQEATEAP